MPPAPDWPSILTGGGGITAATLAAALILGVLVPGWAYKAAIRDRDQAIADRDKALADKDALQKIMLDEIVPLLTRNVDILKAIDARMEPPPIRRREGGR
jgi:hypothetical protein